MTDPVATGLLPPAILVVLAIMLLVAGWRRSAAVALGVLVLLSVEGVSRLLLASLTLPPGPAPETPPGAIVVLASDMPELFDPAGDAPSPETLRRLRVAAALHRRTGLPILVSGARSTDSPVPVASAMALSLRTDFRVDAAWAETGATNLWQSAAASTAILRHDGIVSAYLVAPPVDLRLSLEVFRAAGLLVSPAPVESGDPFRIDMTVIIPTAPAWVSSAVAIRQWVGLACQAVAPCAAWMRKPY